MWIFRRLSWFFECLCFILFHLFYYQLFWFHQKPKRSHVPYRHISHDNEKAFRLSVNLWLSTKSWGISLLPAACPPFRTRVAQTGVSGSGFLPPEIRGGTVIPCSAPQEGWPRWGFTLLPSLWLAWRHIIDAVRSWETLEWEDPFPPGMAGGVSFTKSHGNDEEWLTCVDMWPGICSRAADPMVSGCNAKHYFFLFISDEQTDLFASEKSGLQLAWVWVPVECRLLFLGALA